MSDRRDKIIDVAIKLAEEGGFENVRQRDVAAQAGVALGTLYKSFRGKEEILSAALARETETLEEKMQKRPIKGESAADRLAVFFQTVTRALCRKPNYARAVLRAMASGEPETAARITAYQSQMIGMIIAAMRGVPPGTLGQGEEAPASEEEHQVALLLQDIWFASLVGWSAKLHGQNRVVEQMRTAGRLILAGLEAEQAASAS